MSEERKDVPGKREESTDAQKAAEKTKVTSPVPERVEGQMNPSSPGNTGTTPGTNAKVG